MNGFGIDIEATALLVDLGYTILEMPISWHNPRGSKVSLPSYWSTFVEAMTVYRRHRKTHLPIAHQTK
jgi:hypothetical protein